MVAKGEEGEGVMDWEFGINKFKLLYIEWVSHKVLLYSTGNYILYHVINHNGKEYKKEYIYIYTHTYISESICYTVEVTTTLKINYTSIK